MVKIKRLINFVLPVTACNFQCHYCYVGQEGRNTGDMGNLQYSPEHIQKCLTVERLGGVCHINMCGLGETLLPDYAVDLAIKMLKNGHFVSVVTNGTITRRLKELCELTAEYKKRLFIKFSFHYLELQKKNLMGLFFDNVRMVRQAGLAFTIELTVNDETVPYIQEVQRISQKEAGAVCHVIESRNMLDGLSRLTEMSEEAHKQAWGSFGSDLFDFQQTIWQEKRCEFCYAGDWICSLNVESGCLIPCFGGGNMLQNIFENPEEPIRFTAIGQNCQWTHCFAAYILMSSGAIPEMKAPTYAGFRDRVCSDGSTWLTSDVREFFASKLIESNEEYSVDKKLYINALMALEYNNNSVEYDLKAVGQAAARALQKRNIKSLAVWGRSRYTDWLLEALRNTAVSIRYVVDTEYYTDEQPDLTEKLKHRYKYTLKKWLVKKEESLLLNRYDRLPQVDAMVITDWAHFNGVRQQIPVVYKTLLSLTELAD